MLSVRVANVFDTYVMGRVACVKRPGAYSIFVFGEMIDESFIGDDCQLWKAVHAFFDSVRHRERV
jgi:hypothetical protein